jgi:hypothetical protein
VLKHDKYVHSEHETYHPKIHYYGFFPDDKGNYSINDFNNLNDEALQELATKNDMVYYTDLYGIYSNEWLATYHPEKVKNQRYISQKSNLIYGGLTKNELKLLRIFKNQNKLIITEFNCIAHPTSTEIRREYEKEFHLKWSGWVGRYFESLDTTINMDIPSWLIKNYMTQHDNKWPFTKSGIAFIKEDDTVVIVERGTHLQVDVPYIYTEDTLAEKYGISKKMKYSFWFDIVSVSDSVNSIISEYRIDTNDKGEDLLKKHGIPLNFPAVVANKNELYYYFAGDYCDNPINMSASTLRGIEWFSIITASKEQSERRSFFWHYYRPLLRTILEKYSNTIQ